MESDGMSVHYPSFSVNDSDLKRSHSGLSTDQLWGIHIPNKLAYCNYRLGNYLCLPRWPDGDDFWGANKFEV